jgi:hypothetical protein
MVAAAARKKDTNILFISPQTKLNRKSSEAKELRRPILTTFWLLAPGFWLLQS